jgi:hypothetical protein
MRTPNQPCDKDQDERRQTRLRNGHGGNASTSFQRLKIRTQLQQRELPMDRVTVMHRDLFARAGIAWNEGVDLDGELQALSKVEASRLISQLGPQS